MMWGMKKKKQRKQNKKKIVIKEKQTFTRKRCAAWYRIARLTCDQNHDYETPDKSRLSSF